MSLSEKMALVRDLWSPRVVAELNDYQLKVARLKGDFVWHRHETTDEAFLVLRGQLRIDLPWGAVHLGPGDLYVVPKGVRHKPVAEEEVEVLLIEPRGVVNTGEAGGPLTSTPDVWV